MDRMHRLIRSFTVALAALILIVGASMAASRVLTPENAQVAQDTETDIDNGAVNDINDGEVNQLDNGGGPENQLDNGGEPENQLDTAGAPENQTNDGEVTETQVSGGTSGLALPDAAMSR